MANYKSIQKLIIGATLAVAAVTARAEVYRPYILGDTPPGDMKVVIEAVKGKLKAQGFDLLGTYSPYPEATVIAVTNADLKAAALKAPLNGGFGAAQRVAVTDVKGKIQVSYVNPGYLGTAYGLGKLESVSAKLKAALGAKQDFGSSAGIAEENLKPGSYRYAAFMPYFKDVDLLKEHPDYKTAVDTVEKNLAAGVGGTVKVYRVDLPGDVSVFGVGLVKGAVDGPGKGDKDTDKEILDVVDFQDLRHTAYTPYELMVKGGQVIALRARYRIALHFPDTKMAGEHGFTKIMSAPWGIQVALEKVAGFDRGL
jgi:hypothetical protein